MSDQTEPAVCETCGRDPTQCEVALAIHAGLSWDVFAERDCYRAGLENLRGQVGRAESLPLHLRRLLLRAREQLFIAQSGIRPGRNTTELLQEIDAATNSEPLA